MQVQPDVGQTRAFEALEGNYEVSLHAFEL